MNEIDTSKASRAFDAWIAREVFKFDVVGEARCRNFDGSGWMIVTGWPAAERDSNPLRPVHVAHCVCDIPEISEDRPMFGHYWGCLEVVEWYTSDIAAAYEMEEHIAKRGPWQQYACWLVDIVGYAVLYENGIKTTTANPWDLCHASPLQRCQAAYRMLTAPTSP